MENSHHNHGYMDKEKHKHVLQVDLDAIHTVNDLTIQWSRSGVFGAGRLGKAIDILEAAELEGTSVFVGLAGAMVPGGMRKVIVQAIRDGRINALTTTGANVTHDLMEAFGGSHVRDVTYESDVELRDRGIDRVWDSFVAEGSFESFEDAMRRILRSLYDEKQQDGRLVLTPSQFLTHIGSIINDHDSIVRAAYDMGVPIFIPAFSDSVMGLQVWLFSQFNNLIIDSTGDLGIIQDLFHEAKSCCALLLGGGVPKNYTLQAALMASKHYKYAIQITMDRVETGGLSGASLSEAISWGKLEPDAKFQTVVADISIVLPIIYATLRKRKVIREGSHTS